MLKKLVAGEYSLKQIFWGFGVLGILVFVLITGLTRSSFVYTICGNNRACGDINVIWFIMKNFIALLLRGGTVATHLVLHLITSAVFGAYMLMVLRGLWKSAAQYGGPKFWEWCAKILLLALMALSIKWII